MVPKLRFGGFKEEWTMTLLSKLATKITDGTHDTPDTTSEGVPYLTAIHVKDGYIDYKNCYYLDKLTHSFIYKRCNPEKNDLLIVNIGAGTGTCALNTVDYEFSLKNVALVKPNKNKIYPFYLLQVQRKNAKKLFHELTSGGAQPFLSLKEIGKIKIPLCQYDEQTKIADFLSSVDDKITLLNQQYDLLCQYKKGMMQKIFNQELRFKDENGEEFPEWNYDEISSLFSNKSKKYNPLSGINYPCIEMDCISQRDGQLLTTLDSTQQQSIKNVFKKGDVLFGKLRPYLRKYILATFDGVCSSEIWVFKGILINNSYLYQFIQTDFFINLANKSTGSKMPRADWDTISSTFVFYPCLEEQSKIANFLSALDDKIAVKKAELDKLKTWKQGLLQQMFV
ncbi:restriction endonuclease subunit S [[Enterobacter] lignolyticus]|uniref:Restriction modification system DNA specificity domain protein n=1 Tax=Enterobacter lignolyticus (strain SCF1) TaxID=701347 RepID=E3G2L5_ENTLS|nr:restriction endonuclease subunit S [[Enterobacter] lignolyticus]ADO46954.1 restriction modification system DNA specificity domain protein [[Enterobacter] lignolyticus SCF1]